MRKERQRERDGKSVCAREKETKREGDKEGKRERERERDRDRERDRERERMIVKNHVFESP